MQVGKLNNCIKHFSKHMGSSVTSGDSVTVACDAALLQETETWGFFGSSRHLTFYEFLFFSGHLTLKGLVLIGNQNVETEAI